MDNTLASSSVRRKQLPCMPSLRWSKRSSLQLKLGRLPAAACALVPQIRGSTGRLTMMLGLAPLSGTLTAILGHSVLRKINVTNIGPTCRLFAYH